MCLRRRTWRQLHAGILLFMVVLLIPAWLSALQSQDTINATLYEQTRHNADRIGRLEQRQDSTDNALQGIRWMLGLLSGQIIIEIGKFLHSRTGNKSEHPPRIYDRRAAEREDYNNR